MDYFKKAQGKFIGIGGLHCRCCNYNARKKGRRDKKLNRMARAVAKDEAKSIIFNCLYT